MKLEDMNREELKEYARKNAIRLYTTVPEKMRKRIRDVEYSRAHHGDAFRYWLDAEKNGKEDKTDEQLTKMEDNP